jgi:hypothetical protein
MARFAGAIVAALLLLATAVVGLLTVVACAAPREPQPTSPGVAAASAAATAELSIPPSVGSIASHGPPETVATVSPRASDVAISASPLSALDRSNIFWDNLTGGDYAPYFESVSALANDADLIIIGHVTEVQFGVMVDGWEVGRASVSIDEVLKGEPQTLTAGAITLQTVPAYDRQATIDNLPSHANLFFLWYAPALMERLGQPPEEQQASLYLYNIVNGKEGLVRNIDGIARVLDPQDEIESTAALHGQRFQDVVDQVRRLVN